VKGNIYLAVTQEQHCLRWHLQRSERRNALGPTLGQELATALETAKSELNAWHQGQDFTAAPPYRCLILSAEPVARDRGTPIWIAGGDLKELADLTSPQEGRDYAALFIRITEGLQDLPIPVLVSLDGLAIGGGAELALAGDLRFATRSSELHFKQLEVGLTTGYGTCQRLVALVGQARATDLLLLRRKLSATEALAYGLINELTEDAEALEKLLQKTVEDFAQLSPWALAAQKFMLNGPARTLRKDLLAQELDLFESLWMHGWHKDFLAPWGTT
jgi:enoyl-CoA hydratase/carnithine racemase